MYDVIIIGKGPAGISAALYTLRANLKTLIIAKNYGPLIKADRIENYYGFSEPISGEYLLKQGEEQALRLGANIIEDEAIAVENTGYFKVLTADREFEGKAILLASGQSHKKIHIRNLEEFEGRGISYCTTCDGFFYKNLRVGVLGFRDYALHEASELEAFTRDITIYTNGKPLELTEKYLKDVEKYKVNTKRISGIEGGEFIEKLVFEDGSGEEIDGLFVAYESASSTDFARKLGIITEGSSVVVDKDQQTNVEGIFAAGDCTGGFKQISTAVGQGALAARKIIEFIKMQNTSK